MPEHCPFCKRLEALVARRVNQQAIRDGRPVSSELEKARAAQSRRNTLENVADKLFALLEAKP